MRLARADLRDGYVHAHMYIMPNCASAALFADRDKAIGVMRLSGVWGLDRLLFGRLK